MAEPARPLSQAARELRIRPDLRRLWQRRLEGVGPGPAPGRVEGTEEEVRRRRRELAVVRQERDFLEKAPYFAKGLARSTP